MIPLAVALAGGQLISQILIVAAVCAAIYIIGQLILKIDTRFTYGIMALVFIVWLISLLSGWRI
jgi:hypothetical protein